MWNACVHTHTYIYKDLLFLSFDCQEIYTYICIIYVYTHTLLCFLWLFIYFSSLEYTQALPGPFLFVKESDITVELCLR